MVMVCQSIIYWLLILWFLCRVDSSLNCSAGTQLIGNRCVNCNPSFASTAGGICRNVGITCSPGTAVLVQPTYTICQNCAPGFFCARGQCLTPNPTDRSNGCIPCPPGTGADGPKAALCTPDPSIAPRTLTCPPGTGVVNFLRGCYACNSTTFNNGSSLFCGACPPGFMPNPTSSDCTLIPCEAGYYRRFNSVNSHCLRCPMGSASPPGYVNSSGCLPSAVCGPGESPRVFSSDVYDPLSSDQPCRPCAANRYCRTGQCIRFSAPNSRLMQVGCPTCPGNLRTTGLGSIQCTTMAGAGPRYCPPGTGVNTLTSVNAGCYNCSGSSINNGKFAECQACPAGRSPNANFTVCSRLVCLNGQTTRNGTCVNCPIGTASASGSCHQTNLHCGPGNGQVSRGGSFACVPCPVNSFCSLGRCLSGAGNNFQLSGCNACPPNWGSQFTGASMCTPFPILNLHVNCPVGTGRVGTLAGCINCTNTQWNNGSFLSCQPCPPGMISDPQTLGFCIVPPCLAGLYRQRNNVSFPCKSCAPGTLSPAGFVSETGCIRNSLSKYMCGPGQVPTEFFNPPGCYPTGVNRYCLNGRCFSPGQPGRSPLCPPSTFATQGGAVLCTSPLNPTSPCPPGTGRHPGQEGCYNCTGNEFQSGLFSTCTQCPPRQPPLPDRSACAPFAQCLAGTEQTENNTCQICKPGFASQPGSPCISVNLNCPPGSAVLLRSSSSMCQTCPEGTYCQSGRCLTTDTQNPTRGCLPCPTGMSSSSTGATACTSTFSPESATCPAGSGMFSIFSGCYPCSETSFNPTNFRNRICTPCPRGFVSNPTGTACIRRPCIAGYYINETSKECKPCPPFTASESGASQCTATPGFSGCPPGQMVITTSVSPWRFMCEDCGVGTYCDTGHV